MDITHDLRSDLIQLPGLALYVIVSMLACEQAFGRAGNPRQRACSQAISMQAKRNQSLI